MEAKEKKVLIKFNKEVPSHIASKNCFVGDKETIHDLYNDDIVLAHKNICSLWDKDVNARGFVIHLVNAFLTYYAFSRIFNSDEKMSCAICGHELTTFGNIAKVYGHFGMERMIIRAQALSNNQETLNEDQVAFLEKIRDSFTDAEKHCRVAVGSERSEKFLQVETIYALNKFCEAMMDGDHSDTLKNVFDKKMQAELRKAQQEDAKRYHERKKKDYETKHENILRKPKENNIGEMMSDKSIDALMRAKEQLEKQNN